MPALQKPPARLPRFVPHVDSGANRGAGTFLASQPSSGLISDLVPAPQNVPAPSESLDRLAHDARNVLSSLMLYGDLLSAPGVLGSNHGHIAPELEGLTKAAAQLMEKILQQTEDQTANQSVPPPSHPTLAATYSPAAFPIARPVPIPTVPVTDLAAELRHLQPLLAAIAGPAIKLSIATMPCAGRTALAIEDLTRILVNLVRNSADAMPSGGHIRIAAQYGDGLSFLDTESPAPIGPPRSVVLSLIDNGPGIPARLHNQVFDFGFTTRIDPTTRDATPGPEWPAPRRRGIGLSIVRHLVESAGGTVRIAPSPTPGTHFEIVLPISHPVTSGTYATPPNSTFATDSAMKGRLECR